MEQSKFYQIKNITEHEYTLVGCDGSVITRPIQGVDKSASAFTIEDAKDGDVFVASDGSIFIYKCQRNNSVVHYIAMTSCNDLAINENDYSWENKNGCHLATKEQRDLLFARMKEAGYSWNVYKKELTKE